MRLRTDMWWDAGAKRVVQLGARPDPRTSEPTHGEWAEGYIDMLNDDSFEAAQPGDVWEFRVDPNDPRVQHYGGAHPDWIVIGYGLTCPAKKCTEGIHVWTHASDCEARYGQDRKCKSGGPSCWTWSGSVEEGTLTAAPSLWAKGSCGWHGFLQNGRMTSV